MKKRIVLALCLGLLITGNTLMAQNKTTDNSKYQLPKISNFKLHFGTHLLMRYIESNPGTFSEDGRGLKHIYDMGIRRTRFSAYGRFFNQRLAIYTQLAAAPLTINSGKSGISLNDLWAAYCLPNDKLTIGAGLHGWSGVLRINNISAFRHILADHTDFAFPNLSKTDRSARIMGVFFKGQLARFNYRFSINHPFVTEERQAMGLNKSNYYPNNNLNYKGYVFFSFLDKEKFNGSYVKMSYLGKKNIFNIGFGGEFHPQSMAHLNTAGEFVKTNQLMLGVDVFVDSPLENEAVITFYSSFSHYQFGKNYLRAFGQMNSFKTGFFKQGGGNSCYALGTGNIVFTTLAYLFPEFSENSGRFQLAAAFTLKDFEALDGYVKHFDIGVNYYLPDNNTKLSLFYTSRSIFENYKYSTQKSMIRLQLQFFI